MALERPFYVKETGHRWAMMAVSYKTRDEATNVAQRASERNTTEATVCDCSEGPVGVTVAVYRNGHKVE